MKLRVLLHHSGGVVIRAIGDGSGPPAYYVVYDRSHLRRSAVRRVIRDRLRADLEALPRTLAKKARPLGVGPLFRSSQPIQP